MTMYYEGMHTGDCDDYGPSSAPTSLKCYLCAHPSERMNDERTARWPRRQVVKVNAPRPRAADPTESYTLSCGHTII